MAAAEARLAAARRSKLSAAQLEELDAKLVELRAERDLLAKGEHPALASREPGLRRVRDRRVAAAARFRDLQISALHAMFEYDRVDAEEAYQSHLSALRAGLEERIDQQTRKLQALRGVPSVEERQHRHTRSSKRGVEDTRTMVLPSGRRPRKNGPLAALQRALPEDDIAADLRAIAEDMTRRSPPPLLPSAPPPPGPLVDARVEEGVLVVDKLTFKLGASLSVFSAAHSVQFLAVLTAVGDDKVALRTSTGARLSVTLAQLSHGSVRVALPEGAAQAASARTAGAKRALEATDAPCAPPAKRATAPEGKA